MKHRPTKIDLRQNLCQIELFFKDHQSSFSALRSQKVGGKATHGRFLLILRNIKEFKVHWISEFS